jgi:predicted nucleic-acid-binding Zn-ribbon protein
MSEQQPSVSGCDHDYVEDEIHAGTGDAVAICCHCDKILSPLHHGELPKHWFDHIPQLNKKPEPVKLARDILNGGRFESRDERFVHICGACGHWLTAVHGDWFTKFGPEEEIETHSSGFVGHLREALCPDCGSACFRDGSIVAPLQTAHSIDRHYDATRYVRNRADSRIWKNGVGSFERTVDLGWKLQSSLYNHGWFARCPACGYAECYEDREFDFHHWEYEDEVGCCLCRNCHEHIHDGSTAEEQSRTTGRDWRYDAVKRLLKLSQQNGLSFEREHGFIARYNIPESGAARSAVSEVFADE